MSNPNHFRRKDDIRPLASIPNKEGYLLIGVHKNGTEARLTVVLDANGFHTVPGYSELAGWKHV